MIEYIFAMFMLQTNFMEFYTWSKPDNAEMAYCSELNLAASFVDTDELYRAAEVRYKDNESRLERFYAFWENRDTCISKPRKD